MTPPTVVLFDIDGTLVTTGGAGRRAIDRAFAAGFGRPDACSHFSFDGMTDYGIFRRGLEAIGQPCSPEFVADLLQRYLAVLDEEVRATPDDRYFVHAGMREAVRASHAAGFAVGLGTGNVRGGAMAKLARVALSDAFAFGGFGDDHELRAELIRVGAERGCAALRCARDQARVVVIGDTPKDVAAAQAIGAESIGVATGAHPVDELLACGATAAFEDFTQPGALEFLLSGKIHGVG